MSSSSASMAMRLLLAASSLGWGSVALVVDTAIELDTALHHEEDAGGSGSTNGLGGERASASGTAGLGGARAPTVAPSPGTPTVSLLSTLESDSSAQVDTRRLQNRMPESVTKALAMLPPIPQTVAAVLSSGLSLFSAGARAAAKNVVPESWFEPAPSSGELEAAPSPPSAVTVRDVSPAALASKAPSVLKLIGGGRRAAPEQASYYLVETRDVGLWGKTSGLAYRRSKSLEDRDPSVKPATWGSTISGADEGDGWLKVGDRYLPTKLDGKPVVTKATPASGVEAAKLAQTAVESVVSTCPHPAMPEKELFAPYLQCLAARCEDWDPAMVSGISCEGTLLPLGCEADLSALKLPVTGTVSRACPTLCGACTGRFQQESVSAASESGNGESVAKWTPSHATAASLLREVSTPTEHGPTSSDVADVVPPYRPSVQAEGIEFEDEDDRPDYVQGRVLIKKAKREDAIGHYNLYWARSGQRLPGMDVIQMLPHGGRGKDIEFLLPSSKIPEGAEGLVVLTSNLKGMMDKGPMVFWDEPTPTMATIFKGFLGLHGG